MMTAGTRTGLRIAALGAAAALLLAACTSEPTSDLSSSASDSAVSAPTDEASSAASGATEPTNAAGEACSAYFQLDLLNSTYVGGAVADGDMTEAQVRADFMRLLRIMVSQGKIAVEDGSVNAKLVANATKMRKAVKGLSKSQALSDLTKKQQDKFALQSSRVQRACDAAGFPLPEDNNTARRAAGI